MRWHPLRKLDHLTEFVNFQSERLVTEGDCSIRTAPVGNGGKSGWATHRRFWPFFQNHRRTRRTPANPIRGNWAIGHSHIFSNGEVPIVAFQMGPASA